MRARGRIGLGLLLALALAAGDLAEPRQTQAPNRDLIVSAAVSLKDALDEIARLYHAERPGEIVRFNLGGSGTLERQIEQGAPVDLFISASSEDMDKLQSKALVLAGTRKDLLKNRIVLIVPAGTKTVAGFADLAKPEVKFIAIGEPQTVPAGEYAQEVLRYFGLYDRLKGKYVLSKDVRQVLTYVASGNADAGIVYATDAEISKQVSVAAIAPEPSHAPVIYPVAVMKLSKSPADAEEFESFLSSAPARVVFEKYGFAAPSQ